MGRSVVVAVVVALVTGAVAGSAAASVRVTLAPGSVYPGEMASTTVVVTPPGRCRIGVYYSIRKARAPGLGAKTGKKITWAWIIGVDVKSGRFPVKIDCGSSGKAQTTIRVL